MERDIAEILEYSLVDAFLSSHGKGTPILEENDGRRSLFTQVIVNQCFLIPSASACLADPSVVLVNRYDCRVISPPPLQPSAPFQVPAI